MAGESAVSGVVANVVPFGAFVDIGVGTSGLIHSSKVRLRRIQGDQSGCYSRVVGIKTQVKFETFTVYDPYTKIQLLF